MKKRRLSPQNGPESWEPQNVKNSKLSKNVLSELE
jgi:hypothetical protein